MMQKELWVTYALWLFGGTLGLHKFYLGKIGWGIIYLLTFGLFFIGWLIDLFLIPSQVRRVNQALRFSSVPHPVCALQQTCPAYKAAR
jgi:TM2 domain-containing membrane protein YozV